MKYFFTPEGHYIAYVLNAKTLHRYKKKKTLKNSQKKVLPLCVTHKEINTDF